jgi:hypothetical protein
MIAGLALVLGSVLAPADGVAQAEAYDVAQVRQVIAEVLTDEDFGTRQEIAYWRYTGEVPIDAEREADWLRFVLGLVQGLNRGIAPVAEVLLWILLGLAVAFLGWRWLVKRPPVARRSPRHRPAGRALLEVVAAHPAPVYLPADVPAAALGLLAADRPRAALSLLYRASLARFRADFALPVSSSATEGECLRLVQARLPRPHARLFTRLTVLWRGTAYGHQTPSAREIADLSRNWQRLYRVTDAA